MGPDLRLWHPERQLQDQRLLGALCPELLIIWLFDYFVRAPHNGDPAAAATAIVQTANWAVFVRRVLAASSYAMDARAFLAGHRLAVDEILG